MRKISGLYLYETLTIS
jgi:hypothetical protein